METKSSYISITLRVIIVLSIFFSIILTYNTMIVRHDYEVFTNPGGPELDEE